MTVSFQSRIDHGIGRLKQKPMSDLELSAAQWQCPSRCRCWRDKCICSCRQLSLRQLSDVCPNHWRSPGHLDCPRLQTAACSWRHSRWCWWEWRHRGAIRPSTEQSRTDPLWRCRTAWRWNRLWCGVETAEGWLLPSALSSKQNTHTHGQTVDRSCSTFLAQKSLCSVYTAASERPDLQLVV